jgi:hypothetical protein
MDKSLKNKITFVSVIVRDAIEQACLAEALA